MPNKILHVFIKFHCITKSALQLGCFGPASLCILEPLGSQHDWNWKKLLKVHILIALHHVKSFQDKQSNSLTLSCIVTIAIDNNQESFVWFEL